MPFGSLGIAPGEDEWLRLLGQGGSFGMPASAPPSGGLGGATAPFGGPLQLGLAMLANSGPSATKRGFGEILGTSALQSQQAQQSRQDDALRRRYLEAQTAAMGRPKERKPIAVMGPNGPTYVDEQDAINRTPYIPSQEGGRLGTASPSDFTPDSLAAYQKSGDPSVLRRFTASTQAKAPETVKSDRGLMQWENGKWNLVPGTEPQGITGRPIPQGMANDFRANANAINLVDKILPGFNAQSGTSEARNSVGARNAVIDAVLPDAIADNVKNWWDPKGTDTRNFLSNLNSTIIKDRSGAAVTVSEFARQRGYLPTDKDSAQVVEKKLRNLRQAMADEQQYLSDFAESQGYRVPPMVVTSRGASGSWDQRDARKTINGKRYVQQNGQWYEDDGT